MWIPFVAGSSAAMLGGAVTHPIDLVKVRMQLFGAKDGFGYVRIVVESFLACFTASRYSCACARQQCTDDHWLCNISAHGALLLSTHSFVVTVVGRRRFNDVFVCAGPRLFRTVANPHRATYPYLQGSSHAATALETKRPNMLTTGASILRK
jgi:hypothetical protein